MRFTAEVRREPDGRLEGEFEDARGAVVPFSGVIELLGLIEAGLDVAVDETSFGDSDRTLRAPRPGLYPEY